ncbi:hypothetical protein [Flavobacterium sp. UBA6135]|uniref:hypothetical protein n=1 Tax=Flavobacterium sp. UBA6135 TaxID=1946553 RepID=UPI0025BA21E3|nr:hypothetical protein [Flavobacterium sp. UBA6135]
MTTSLKIFILTLAVTLLKCSSTSVPIFQDNTSSTNPSDSLLLAKYKYEILKDYVEDAEALTTEQIDSVLYESRISIANSKVFYAPDHSFKIFTIEIEGCGAYCNSEWKSWIHYNLTGKENSEEVDFTTIDTIYKLPDHNYLIIDKSGRRPASVLTVYCERAHLISFSSDAMITHAIGTSKQETYFGFCQENGVEMDESPYIKYNADKKLLTYHYGNNYAYSQGIDNDTIRQGQLKYVNGQFVFEKEHVKVISRANHNDKN